VGGGRGEEGVDAFCVCFHGFESGGEDGEEGGEFFFFLHKMKRFVRI